MVIYSVLGAFYLFIVLSQMLVVILENRQPVKTVAWLMVLFSLPVVGLVIYFFFGRNRKREHFVSRRVPVSLHVVRPCVSIREVFRNFRQSISL